ncbi:trehalose operon transcriptional repressor [Paenibacillus sp. FSL R7-0273]|uniref:trehalose operon repressor n=1 Tax=Paenibacillus sp. FSL R7-0273 TaxID=1536772 RepID=UPI0004F644BD|nr:trehalose operon repressor [Paenibacillus sp. FSL R7-0273]AIQ48576.1 trehalose operon transcriptional repressor [Paenibacillus sp. FSL R7-0273]OMF87567.1 trehalose operon repressor [Paenibacillus sp. FSL R7-0273]
MRENIYLQIYNEYSSRIHSGQLPAGAKLPSESELAESYGTSRETVRKALNLLFREGYIHKIKGRGSFVLDMTRMDFPVTGLISFKEMSDTLGGPSRTLVEETVQEPAGPMPARQLQIPEEALIWKVTRAREIEGERIILDKDYFRADIVPFLSRDIAAGSIYEYLEGELGLKISYAKKLISVEPSTEEDHRLLDLKKYTHIVVVRNYVYLENTVLFQYTESRHRLDKFQFVDFARRVQR